MVSFTKVLVHESNTETTYMVTLSGETRIVEDRLMVSMPKLSVQA